MRWKQMWQYAGHFYAAWESKEEQWDFKDQLLLQILASLTSKNESSMPRIKARQIVTFIYFFFWISFILCSPNIHVDCIHFPFKTIILSHWWWSSIGRWWWRKHCKDFWQVWQKLFTPPLQLSPKSSLLFHLTPIVKPPCKLFGPEF